MKIKSTLLLFALSGLAFTANAGAGFSSVDQICGEYSLICVQLDDKDYINHFTMNAVPGEEPNEIVFQNFFYIPGYDIPATINFEEGTITFRKLEDFKFMDNYDGMSSFLLYKWNATHTRASEIDEMTATFVQDGTGTIIFDPDYYFSIVVPDGIKPGPMASDERGYQVVCELGSIPNLTMCYQPTQHDFIYFAEQWQYAGQAEFTGMWIAPFAGFNNGENTLTYKVDYYENKENPAKILLMNPYGAGTPWTDPNSVSADYLNVSKEQGYYFIDTTDPDFVLVPTGVKSGYSSKAIPKISCMNQEGYYTYYWGYDRPTVIRVLNNFGMRTYSFRKGNELTIRNLAFITDKAYSLPTEGGEYVTTITLYPGEDSGVEGMEVETTGATRYYNLQGVEVKNPSKGQILIQRSSEGSRKVIF